MPVRPTRESPSTSATSPRRLDPSSVSICWRMTFAARRLHVDDLAVLEPKLEVAHNRALKHEWHRRAHGAVRSASIGVVNTSSVGRFGTCVCPQAVCVSAAIQRERGEADRQVDRGQ